MKEEINLNITTPNRTIEKTLNIFRVNLLCLLLYNITYVIDLFTNMDDECLAFWAKLFIEPKSIINNFASKLFKNGFSSDSIEAEEECINNNDVYILVKLEYSKSLIYEHYEEYANQRILFIESFTSDKELCFTNVCKDLYVDHNNEIIQLLSKYINSFFELDNFEIIGFNYKENKTTHFDITYNEENRGFNNGIFF